MLFAHRSNKIDRVYELYYKHDVKAYEIDVQSTFDNILVVYHDDVSSIYKHELSKDIPTFEEYLKFTPNDIHINVEIKMYPNSKNILDNVLLLTTTYSNKIYSYSSFNMNIYNTLNQKNSNIKVWHLQNKPENYINTCNHICIHVDMLNKIDSNKHSIILVYDVHINDHISLQNKYPFVTGWIVDV